MKFWIGLPILALLIAVGIWIARSRPAVAPPPQPSPKAEPAPLSVPVSNLEPSPGVDVAALLEELVAAVLSGDFEKRSKVQDALMAVGLPAVGPMRRDVLGNEVGGHRDHRYHLAVKDALFAMASPDVGSELLESWPEVDRGAYASPQNASGLRLGFFSEVIARVPPLDAGTRIPQMYAAAKTIAVKRSLIELMGLLQSRFPSLRAELLRILKEDPVAELRSIAAAALAAHDPASAMAPILEHIASVLRDPKDSGGQVDGLIRGLLKCAPIGVVLDALKKEIGTKLEVHQVNKLNSLGFALGYAIGAPGDPNLEVLLGRAASEDSPGMRVLYVGVLCVAPLTKNSDPRLTDLALAYLADRSNEYVRSHALSAITALNRNEETVLGAFDQAWKDGGKMAFYAAGQLKFYMVKNPESAAAATQLNRFLSEGSRDSRVHVLKGLEWGDGTLSSPCVDQLKSMAESDPEASIREAAAKTLRTLGFAR